MKGRAEKEHDAAALAAAANGGQQPQVFNVISNEVFVPQNLNVIGTETQPGAKPTVTLQLMFGQIAPNVFMFCRTATLDPDAAIALGEYLVKEGRRVKSGIEIPVLQMPDTRH